MIDRSKVYEVELRRMLEHAKSYTADTVKGRWVVSARRHRKSWNGVLLLPRRSGQRSYRSIPAGPGLVVDLTRGGKPIGIEITAPEPFRPQP